ncbi:MAG: hypothetical protein NC253_09015 [Ruminococcus sp.]|nr:hypothetical protein [Ruminococcus sp.]MCM1382054.1 hypothetical protein [Muribaculaceae bacterium]MCM1478394.1 hypothetical protein [Muribaculaceae bacterium]
MYRKKYNKNAKYVYLGLIFSAMTLGAFISAVFTTLYGESAAVQITGYLSGVMWGVAAFLSFKVYFDEKKAAEERLEDLSNDNK